MSSDKPLDTFLSHDGAGLTEPRGMRVLVISNLTCSALSQSHYVHLLPLHGHILQHC